MKTPVPFIETKNLVTILTRIGNIIIYKIFHQALLVELSTQFHNCLIGKNCQVFVAPFDVRLPYGGEKDEETQVVVQPDLLVICDRSKLKGTGCFGAPDLVVEIVSPASGKIDRILKFNQYERAAIKEYWILDPDERALSVFKLGENGKYGRRFIRMRIH
jgi:Uma2 family endonuclease